MMIDECHMCGHTACSCAYSCGIFKDSAHPGYQILNDSGPEQRNRVVNKLRKSVSHCRIENFMIQVRLLLEMDNRTLQRRFLEMPTF